MPPSSKSKKPSPSEPATVSSWRLYLLMAWDGWIKSLVVPFLIMITVLAVVLIGVPEEWLGVALTGTALLIPLALIVRDLRRRTHFRRWRLILAVFLGLALVAAAGYPAVRPLLSQEHATRLVFESADDKATIPAQNSDDQWWLLEVNGHLPEENKVAETSYVLHLRNPRYHETVKGVLKRNWRRIRFGRRGHGKKLIAHERNVHRLTADLSQPSTLTLSQLNGRLEGPLEVLLRAEPANWLYLLWVDLPLLLLAGFWDAVEDDERRSVMSGRAAFMLIFGSVFADNWLPGIWLGPIGLALFAALIVAFPLGRLLPKILRPLAKALPLKA